MKGRYGLVLLVALGAATVLFLGSAFGASANLDARGVADATSPCGGLSGSLLSACHNGEASCQKLPTSVAGVDPRSECLTALESLHTAATACEQLPASSRTSCLAQIESAYASLGGNSGQTPTTTTATPSNSPGITTPPPGLTGAASSAGPPPPPPVKGVSADLAPVTGTALVNGSPLTAGTQIPLGATVDTTNGVVSLESISPSGAPQSARFAGAIFKITQPADGITDLTLSGGNLGVCSRKTSSVSAAPTVVRTLWGNGKGSFTTTGRYAAATVRGTIWKTDDRCDGTLIYVKQGQVSVRDLVRKKTVIVTAGKSYLAKP